MAEALRNNIESKTQTFLQIKKKKLALMAVLGLKVRP